MENAKIELVVVEERRADPSLTSYRELLDCELALVGGGMGETIL